MAKFQLNQMTHAAATSQQPERVRIGSVSLFALVVIICLAVLSVLAFSTANASLTMSQRQATAISELYLDEVAAQEFLASVDDVLAGARYREGVTQDDASAPKAQVVRDEKGNAVYDEYGYQVVVEEESGKQRAGQAGLAAIQESLADLCADAREAAGGEVAVTAEVNNGKVAAEFTCENGRRLNIVVAVRNNGTYRIDRWKMSAVQNEEQPEGQLLIFD